MSKKPKKNGAIREGVKRRLILALRVALAVVVMGLIGLTGYRVLHSSAKDSIFQLERIRFEGEVHHLDVAALDSLIRSSFPANTLNIRLETLREFIESETWVKSALVRRRLPGELVARIVERTPVAVATIEGDPMIVDSEGVVLGSYGPAYRTIDRPIVRGLHNTAVENAAEENRLKMQQYLAVLSELDSAPEKYSTAVSEIIVEDPERIAVVPIEVAVPVYLGEDRFRERFETYLAGLDYLGEIRAQHGEIESIDVTYDNKIIVHTPAEDQIASNNGD